MTDNNILSRNNSNRAPEVCPEAMRLLQRLWRGGDSCYLWAKWPGGDDAPEETHWLPTSSPITRPRWDGANIYFGVNLTATKGTKHQRALAKPNPEKPNSPLVAVVNCLYAEYDDATLADVLERLKARGVPEPWVCVFSGGGIHAYWPLTEPLRLTPENRAHVIDVQKGWNVFVGGEKGVNDLARVLRLPGTPNMKPERAINGKPPSVRVVLERDNEYTFAALEALAAPHVPQETPQPPPVVTVTTPHDENDDALWAHMLRTPKNGAAIARLKDGTWKGTYKSQSNADQALCNHLAFWTGKDAGRMDRMFRQSGLMRDKWDKNARSGEIYGAGTIARAIAGCSEVYEGKRAHSNSTPSAPPEDDGYMSTEPPAGGKVQPAAGGLAAFATHDSGNASAFRALHADRFLWNDAYGWLSWEGTHWVHGAEAEALARTAAERMLLQRTTELAGTNAAAGVSPTAARIRNVLTLAQAHVFVRADVFDGTNNKHLINTVSGVVDLRTGQLRAARPADRFLWVVPTPYDPQATVEDEQWRALVLDWVSGKEEMATFLQLAMGYSVTGESREKCLFFLHGAEGNNGKTTFTRAVTDALDCSITRGISLDAFTVASRMADPQGFGLAPLVHARYVPASEGDLKGALKGNVLKAITSHGDPMQVSEKGKQPIEWRPTIKLWPMSNHPPKVAGDDPVGWKRFRVIPFDRVYDGTHADPTLSDKLRTPAMRQAVLRWLVQGAALWYAHGLPQPADVTKATRAAALANDSAARFAEECLETNENAHTPAADLHAAYMTWCEDEGIEDRDRKNKVHLARALGRAGYTQDGSRLWKVGSAGKNA